jgi:hypothetical protein
MCSSRKRRRFFSDIKTYDDSYVSMGTNFSVLYQETRLCHSFGVLQDEWKWHCGALACCRFVHFCHCCEKVGNGIVSTSFFESEIPALQKAIRDEFMMNYCNVIMHQKMTHDILSFFSQPKQR